MGDEAPAAAGDTLPPVMSLAEYADMLDEEEAIIGNASENVCSHDLGYVNRQAVFSCLDCTPLSSGIIGGFCFACSITCHHDHNVEMIYTKRNFKCDCGTIPQLLCNLSEKPDSDVNSENKYNHNFHGLYCTCNRPYPDEDTPEMETVEMVQCSVCEDWLHTTHLNATLPEEYEELVCQVCVSKHPFLGTYRIVVDVLDIEEVDTSDAKQSQLKSTKSDVTTVDQSDAGLTATVSEPELVKHIVTNVLQKAVVNAVKSEEQERIITANQNAAPTPPHEDAANIDKLPVQSESPGPAKRSLDPGQSEASPAAKKQKLDKTDQVKETTAPSCPLSNYDHTFSSACYFTKSFRDNICRCVSCLELFKTHNIEFLLDKNDTIAAYEARSQSQKEEGINAVADVIENLPHQAKCDVARAVGGIRETMKGLIQKFAENNGEVNKEEIKKAFKDLADKTFYNPALFHDKM